MAVAGLVALVSLGLPWSTTASPGFVIPTTTLVVVPDYFYGGTRLELQVGVPLISAGGVYRSAGFETSMRVIAPLIAVALMWALRRGRRAVARGTLVVAVVTPGLTGDWTSGGSTAWLLAVVIAAIGSGLVCIPGRSVIPSV